MMLSILYFLFGIYIIVSQIHNYIKKKKMSYFSFFSIYFLAYYIIPSYVHCTYPDYISRYSYAIQYGSETYSAFILIFISYFCVKIGFEGLSQFKRKTSSNEILNVERTILKEDLFFKKMCIYLTIIGIISFLTYCYLYGGIIKTLTNSALIRDNQIEIVNNTWISFMSRFTICLMYASYIMFIRFLKNNTKIFTLILSITGALLYLVIHAGRAAILTYIITMFLIYVTISKRKIKLKNWILLFLVVLLGVSYIRPFIASLSSINNGFDAFWQAFMNRINNSSHNSINNLLYNLCYNLEHKYVSLEIAIRSIGKGYYSYNFFVDIFIAFISILPSALLPFSRPNSIAYYNTILINGTNFVTGIVPPGGVAFGYYAFGPIGVILFSIVIGFFGRKITKYFDSFDSEYVKGIKIINMFVWIDFFINGELKECLIRYFVFIVILFIIYFNAKKVVKKNEGSN